MSAAQHVMQRGSGHAFLARSARLAASIIAADVLDIAVAPLIADR
jgi:hypothetical protein